MSQYYLHIVTLLYSLEFFEEQALDSIRTNGRADIICRSYIQRTQGSNKKKRQFLGYKATGENFVANKCVDSQQIYIQTVVFLYMHLIAIP